MENITGYSIFRKSDIEEWGEIDKVKGAEKYYYTDENDLEDGKAFFSTNRGNPVESNTIKSPLVKSE